MPNNHDFDIRQNNRDYDVFHHGAALTSSRDQYINGVMDGREREEVRQTQEHVQ